MCFFPRNDNVSLICRLSIIWPMLSSSFTIWRSWRLMTSFLFALINMLNAFVFSQIFWSFLATNMLSNHNSYVSNRLFAGEKKVKAKCLITSLRRNSITSIWSYNIKANRSSSSQSRALRNWPKWSSFYKCIRKIILATVSILFSQIQP